MQKPAKTRLSLVKKRHFQEKPRPPVILAAAGIQSPDYAPTWLEQQWLGGGREPGQGLQSPTVSMTTRALHPRSGEDDGEREQVTNGALDSRRDNSVGMV